MIDLLQCQNGDVTHFFRQAFLENRDRFSSFEDAAQNICQYVFESFQTEGEPIFALVRVFRTFPYRDLPPQMQSRANPDCQTWLALMGTYGLEPQWCKRSGSRKRFLVPLEGEVAPMFKAAFVGIQVSVGDVLPEHQRGQALTDFFYVEDAVGSPVVVDQSQFVQPYGICSVVGVGASFLSGQSYLALFFSRVPLDPDRARYLGELSPFLSTLLALYDERQLFSV